MLPARRRPAPWPGHEHVKGWGVFGLPFDSGHVLALRVFPESDFGSYRTIWHRDPSGRWAIYVDGPRLDTSCPRYYGAACAHTGHARIELTWTGPATLHVVMDRPSLDWTVTARTTALLDLLNGLGRALPLASWRYGPVLALRESIAAALGVGRMQLRGVMPSGHVGTLMPGRMYFIDESQATLDGVDLGRPARLTESPLMGAVTLPARGVLAIGQAMWKIRDDAEYLRTLDAPPDI